MSHFLYQQTGEIQKRKQPRYVKQAKKKPKKMKTETNVYKKRKTLEERFVRRRSFKGFLNEGPQVIKNGKT
jgi:hypothetical protein